MNRPQYPEPKPGVMEIAPYVPGNSAAPAGVAKVYKLSSNENPLGASPKAIDAVKRLAEQADVPAERRVGGHGVRDYVP